MQPADLCCSGMQVVDTSLDDIQFMLNPKYTNDQIEHIDENVHALP